GGHLADHAKVFDSPDAGAVEVGGGFSGRHRNAVRGEPVLEPSGKLGMRFLAGPVAVLTYTLHDVLETVEHEAARADRGVENEIVEGGRSEGDHELPGVFAGAVQSRCPWCRRSLTGRIRWRRQGGRS